MCLRRPFVRAQGAANLSGHIRQPVSWRVTHRRWISGLVLLFVLSGGSARGQSIDDGETDALVQQPAGPPPTPRHTGIRAMLRELGSDFVKLPSKENAAWAGVGLGLALAVHPADDNVTATLTGSDTAKHIFKVGALLGESYTLLAISSTVYATGRIKDQPKVSHVGMDLIRALAVSEALAQTIKYTTRRERPDQSGATSFPSGHAADTVAAATALERHLGWRYAVPAYTVASYVAASRLPANRHWLSDVVFGSAVGIIAGRTVTSQEQSKYALSILPVPGGVAAAVRRRAF